MVKFNLYGMNGSMVSVFQKKTLISCQFSDERCPLLVPIFRPWFVAGTQNLSGNFAIKYESLCTLTHEAGSKKMSCLGARASRYVLDNAYASGKVIMWVKIQ